MVKPMEQLLSLLLQHPESFQWSDVPCCLWGFLELHDEPPRDDRMPGTSRPLRTNHQPARCRALWQNFHSGKSARHTSSWSAHGRYLRLHSESSSLRLILMSGIHGPACSSWARLLGSTSIAHVRPFSATPTGGWGSCAPLR